MFTLPPNTIAYLYKQPMDMRLGMSSLQGVISAYESHNLTKGAFYIFTNRPHTLLKAVWFDGTGICLFSKRLEKGQFSWPSTAILYTMMEECKRCKVDSLAWLTWVLDRLPNYRGDYRDLYPSAMPKSQESVKERTI